MLCLSLREGEYVMVGDSIRVHFNRTKGNELVLGFEAPRDVTITRSNVYEDELKKQAEEGNQGARELSAQLQEEHAGRRERYESRPASLRRTKQERRTAV